jgi:propanediol utilization protein
MVDLKKILIEVSNRHVHLSKEDTRSLFGNCLLKPIRNLSQPNQFVCSEKINLMGKFGILGNVRVLGPEREKTQIEVLKSDLKTLGFEVPFRHSGDLEGSPGVQIEGPSGKIRLGEGVIISHNHLHISEEEADELRLKNRDKINLRIGENKNFILENVFVRRGVGHKLAVHIDRDVGKELGVDRVCYGELV